MTEYEFSGKTVEEAVENGLKMLNLTEETAEYTVLDEGKKGGFLSKGIPARIKMHKKLTDGERAVEFLEGIFGFLNVTATTELEETDETTNINVITPDSYALIGHRGEVLDALQVIAGAAANIGRENYKRVVVDCENYREKREQTLRHLAKKLEEKAVRLGRKVSLEPMTPYERRIIHSELAESEQVKTASEGKEPNRYIVVIPNNLRPGSDRPDRRNGGRRNDRGFNRDRRDNREGGERRERRFDRDRRDNREDRPRATGLPRSKREPYFGTFLGNANDIKNSENKED